MCTKFALDICVYTVLNSTFHVSDEWLLLLLGLESLV